MKATEPSDQRTKVHEELSLLKRVNARLIQERESLRMDLEECTSDLLKRMPPTQISDDSIQKALERIHGSIDEFVFEIMGDIDEDALYKFCQRKHQKRNRKSRKPPNPLNSFIMKEDISLWGPYECSNFYILSVIIQWILDDFVFRYDNPRGVTEEHIRVLKEVEKGMWQASRIQSWFHAHVTPKYLSDRDVAEQEKFEVWRSETLTALTALHENETRLEEVSRDICNRLNNILSPWLFEAGPFTKVEERFRQEILDPAIKLHQDLKSSSHQYETRRTNVFDRVSSRQMLEEWYLKDADTWQKVRSEREVGRALYCLHPSIVRLRAKGTIPIVVAKPVIVVKSPARERVPDPRSHKDSPLSVMTAPPAVIEPGPATDHIISSLNQGATAQIKFADKRSVSTDSDSTTDSRRRRLSPHGRRASTHPTTTQKHEDMSGPPQRTLSVPVEPYHRQEERPGHYSKSHLERGRQSPGRAKADHHQEVLPYTRGHYIEGSSYTHQSQGAARQLPSRKSSRDASGRSAYENPQPPIIAPSTPPQSTPSAKSRWKLFSGQ